MAQTRSPEVPVDQAVDDLKKVSGIGLAVEQHLHNAGIVRYAQLANLKPKKVASLVKEMKGFTEKRIVAEDWLGQAQRLAAEAGELHPLGDPIAAESSENSKHRQHYAVFTCELLLDRLNQVRRTRVMHVQSQQEVAWAGWVPSKLESFFIQSAQLSITGPSQVEQASEPAGDPESVASLAPAAEVQSHPAPNHLIHGALKIDDFQLCDLEKEKLGVLIPADQSFSVQLSLDLRQVRIETGERLSYAAEVYVRNLENSEPLAVNKNEGCLTLEEKGHKIEIQGQPLPPGDYNLEALVMLWPQTEARGLRNQLAALTEGMLIHCY